MAEKRQREKRVSGTSKIWRWLYMNEGTPETNRNSGVPDSGQGPLAYRLVLTAILCVSGMFVVIMAIFGFLGVFDEATQVVAALSSAFAVIGTLVGAYFGIKSSSEARDTVERIQSETAAPMREVAKQAANAAVSAEKAAQKVASATEQTPSVVVPPVAPPNGSPSE
jgi:uncharacterized protein YdbL (DUF1318 family)